MPLDLIRYAATALEVILLGAILYRGLARRIPFFTALVAMSAARSLLLMGLSPASQPYARLWTMTEPALAGLEIACVHEAFRLGLASYRRLGQAATWALAGGVSVGALVTALTLLTEQGAGWQATLRTTITVHRALTGVAVVFLSLTILMLKRYQVPEAPIYGLHRNVLWLYLTSKFLTLWGADLVGQKSIQDFNWGLMSAACACLLAWTWVLRPGGETVAMAGGDDGYWRGQAEGWLNRTDQSRLSNGNARL